MAQLDSTAVGQFSPPAVSVTLPTGLHGPLAIPGLGSGVGAARAIAVGLAVWIGRWIARRGQPQTASGRLRSREDGGWALSARRVVVAAMASSSPAVLAATTPALRDGGRRMKAVEEGPAAQQAKPLRGVAPQSNARGGGAEESVDDNTALDVPDAG